ncbi:hypothetical protein [Methylobacterium crusticola]|uniref:hypothetical protein n=1 Tax=Methylobacterium crusticola TaxID=1697972 RepID=UPI000FFC5B9E|nr:hypothetical protein [Methylobacterium crusticola]
MTDSDLIKLAIETLNSRPCASISFDYFNGYEIVAVRPSLYIKIAELISSKAITIKIMPLPNGRNGEYYDRSNFLYLSQALDPGSLKFRRTLVHESTHAAIDMLKCKNMWGPHEEIIAFVAAACYVTNTGEPLGSVSEGTYATAVEIAKKIKRSPNSSLDWNLVSAMYSGMMASATYRAATKNITNYDGIRR